MFYTSILNTVHKEQLVRMQLNRYYEVQPYRRSDVQAYGHTDVQRGKQAYGHGTKTGCYVHTY